MKKLLAFDLDGTLTQHRSPLEGPNKAMLEALGRKYKLILVGAGTAMRIFNQIQGFPIDIIGNYGLQYGRYNAQTRGLDILRDEVIPCDRPSVIARINELRARFGYTEFAGDTCEFSPSGAVVFALLGTKAKLQDKLAFDPDRSKRRKFYHEVVEAFPEFVTFIGGSSSFDMAPRPYDKYYALDLYCRENGLAHDEVLYCGDDYGLGGNDEAVYRSDFDFITVDNYRDFPQRVQHLL